MLRGKAVPTQNQLGSTQTKLRIQMPQAQQSRLKILLPSNLKHFQLQMFRRNKTLNKLTTVLNLYLFNRIFLPSLIKDRISQSFPNKCSQRGRISELPNQTTISLLNLNILSAKRSLSNQDRKLTRVEELLTI